MTTQKAPPDNTVQTTTPRPTADIVKQIRDLIDAHPYDSIAALMAEAADRLEAASTIPNDKHIPWELVNGATWLRDIIASGEIDGMV